MIYVLIGLAAFGYLPLLIVLWRRRRVRRLLDGGTRTVATVQTVFYVRRSHTDIVHYVFLDSITGRQYAGSLTIKHGVYKIGDSIETYYDPGNPKRNTVKGAWASKAFILFVLIIGLFTSFAAYKIWEMVQSGEM
jgi:hypothetical protein